MLRDIGAALNLPIDATKVEALERFLALLQRWNATYNLTAVREPQEMLTHHMADCLAAVAAWTHSPEAAGKLNVLDVGSGGGLPGVVMAVMKPEATVTCIDAVGKKAAFVRQVAGALNLNNLRAVHGRVEQQQGQSFDLITARAFASLADLVKLTRPILAPQGLWMAMKAQVPDNELAALPPEVEAFHVEPLQVPGLEAKRCLVWMRPRRSA